MGGLLAKANVDAHVHQGAIAENAVNARMERGAVQGTMERGAATATVERGAVQGTVERGAMQGTVERGAVQGTVEKGAATATVERGAVHAAIHRGAFEAKVEQGAAKADIQGLVHAPVTLSAGGVGMTLVALAVVLQPALQNLSFSAGSTALWVATAGLCAGAALLHRLHTLRAAAAGAHRQQILAEHARLADEHQRLVGEVRSLGAALGARVASLEGRTAPRDAATAAARAEELVALERRCGPLARRLAEFADTQERRTLDDVCAEAQAANVAEAAAVSHHDAAQWQDREARRLRNRAATGGGADAHSLRALALQLQTRALAARETCDAESAKAAQLRAARGLDLRQQLADRLQNLRDRLATARRNGDYHMAMALQDEVTELERLGAASALTAVHAWTTLASELRSADGQTVAKVGDDANFVVTRTAPAVGSGGGALVPLDRPVFQAGTGLRFGDVARFRHVDTGRVLGLQAGSHAATAGDADEWWRVEQAGEAAAAGGANSPSAAYEEEDGEEKEEEEQGSFTRPARYCGPVAHGDVVVLRHHATGTQLFCTARRQQGGPLGPTIEEYRWHVTCDERGMLRFRSAASAGPEGAQFLVLPTGFLEGLDGQPGEHFCVGGSGGATSDSTRWVVDGKKQR